MNTRFKSRLLTAMDMLIIAAIWCAAVIIVNPRGDFPLNDDWSYTKVLLDTLETGHFHPIEWPAMALLTHILWSVLVCVVFGFSFIALRISVLFLGMIGILCFYALLRYLGVSRKYSLLATGVLAFNPLFFILSQSFMTDVPFTVCILLALFFFVRYIRTDAGLDYWIGTVLVVIAILCREIGMFLPFAFGLVSLRREPLSCKVMTKAAIPALAGMGGIVGLRFYLISENALTRKSGAEFMVLLNAIPTIPDHIVLLGKNILMLLFYLGLFLFPLLILTTTRPPEGKRRFKIYSHILFLFFFVSAVVLLIVARKTMPLSENILIRGGLGPATLHDTYILKLPFHPELPDLFWFVVTGISIWGGGLLVSRGFLIAADLYYNRKPMRTDRPKQVLVLFFAAALFYAALLVYRGFYDRYLIPLLPLVVGIIVYPGKPAVPSSSRITAFAAMGVLFGLIVYSVAGTRDYFAFNRLRWQSLRLLMEQDHIPPTQIDGGFEFNAWYLYDPKYKRQKTKSTSWWWVHDDTYLLSVNPVTGYTIWRQYTYRRWLPPEKSHLYILRRGS